MHIRRALEEDFPALWPIFHSVVAAGETYPFLPDTTRDTAFAYWFGAGIKSFVAEDGQRIIGMYKLVANQVGLGAHVANASFMVDPACRGMGAGKAMGLHCLHEAHEAKFTAMQFNFVVSTNTAAVALWQKLGFEIVGTLPKAFRHATLGLVDAFVMYRFLENLDEIAA